MSLKMGLLFIAQQSSNGINFESRPEIFQIRKRGGKDDEGEPSNKFKNKEIFVQWLGWEPETIRVLDG